MESFEACSSEEIELKQNSISYKDRDLTGGEKAKLDSDDNVVSVFKQTKLEKEAKKNWDLFYKRNTTKFFKDRHWTKREFQELCSSESEDDTESKVFFEVGCGVGNFMFPLLQDDKSSFFYACDFSPRAVDFVKHKESTAVNTKPPEDKEKTTPTVLTHPAYNAERCKAFQCDIISDTITDNVPEGSVDVATLIFVLSAIHPEKMITAVQNVIQTLKPGGTLLFRDYGLYDHAMLRFAKGHKLSDCFYVRQDGTRAYYFSIDKLESIMTDSGLDVGHCSYIHRATVNKKEDINIQRTFVQGKFVKPVQSSFPSDLCENSSHDCDIKTQNSLSQDLMSHEASVEKSPD